jgi:ABC-2 type transport system permease protein
MIFYIVILGSASLLLSSVTKEKENRIIEILMVSATPRQLLMGKILGLGIVGLLQTVLWVGTGYVLLQRSTSMFNLSAAFKLPVEFLIWGVVFFLLGYAVYASLMAGLGALVPNMREASQATIVVISPLILPMFLMNILINAPHGSVSTALSIIPFTSPIVMMTRLSAGGVPWWQPLLAVLLLLITVVLVIRAVSGMFRAQTLLSGQPFKVQTFFYALIGRV